ncbi:hypothetical protein AAFG07_06055 [Bradyrhizobium sp. B097]
MINENRYNDRLGVRRCVMMMRRQFRCVEQAAKIATGALLIVHFARALF